MKILTFNKYNTIFLINIKPISISKIYVSCVNKNVTEEITIYTYID